MMQWLMQAYTAALTLCTITSNENVKHGWKLGPSRTGITSSAYGVLEEAYLWSCTSTSCILCLLDTAMMTWQTELVNLVQTETAPCPYPHAIFPVPVGS